VGRRQATSHDVARRAGVSRTTVSFVLNNVPGVKITEETRSRVFLAARELHYYPTAAARSLASGKTYRIGLILGDGQERLAADAFLPTFLQGVTASVHRRGYLLLVQLAEDVPSHEAYIKLIREQQVDGVILSGPRSDDPVIGQLSEEGFPLILHGRLEGHDLPYVDVDNEAGAYQAVSHLLWLGHRHIGFISNAPFSYSGAHDRFAGYRRALTEHTIPLQESMIRTASFLPDSGRKAMQSLLDSPAPPTAVFAASDVIAMGAMGAIHSAGLRIPEDIAVVGFDDIFLAAYAHPPLTTVRVPAYGLGWTAAEVLISLVEGDEEASSVALETELVIRDSCGARKQAQRGAGSGESAVGDSEGVSVPGPAGSLSTACCDRLAGPQPSMRKGGEGLTSS
jgi:LacI family transcriptional regulator